MQLNFCQISFEHELSVVGREVGEVVVEVETPDGEVSLIGVGTEVILRVGRGEREGREG